MRILIDAFGGDNSPVEMIAGGLLALKEKQNFTAVFVGDEDKIKEQLSSYDYPKDRVEIIDAKEVITCEEEPTLAIRRKPDSSICVAFKNLKEDETASAFVSAGSTGAVLVGATLKLGRIRGVNRPALCPVLPTVDPDKKVLLMDAGANADCKPINLSQFAVMGSVYAKTLGVKDPKVALLSNGTEEKKGNALCHEAMPLLKQTEGINFVGNVEAREICSGDYDVIVTDGFTGNIALKSLEGAMKVLIKVLKEEIKSSPVSMLGGLLLKGKFKKVAARLDYNKVGGAAFIGVEKPVIKAHGSSDRNAFKCAVLQAVSLVESGVNDKIRDNLKFFEGQEGV